MQGGYSESILAFQFLIQFCFFCEKYTDEIWFSITSSNTWIEKKCSRSTNRCFFPKSSKSRGWLLRWFCHCRNLHQEHRISSWKKLKGSMLGVLVQLIAWTPFSLGGTVSSSLQSRVFFGAFSNGLQPPSVNPVDALAEENWRPQSTPYGMERDSMGRPSIPPKSIFIPSFATATLSSFSFTNQESSEISNADMHKQKGLLVCTGIRSSCWWREVWCLGFSFGMCYRSFCFLILVILGWASEENTDGTVASVILLYLLSCNSFFQALVNQIRSIGLQLGSWRLWRGCFFLSPNFLLHDYSALSLCEFIFLYLWGGMFGSVT